MATKKSRSLGQRVVVAVTATVALLVGLQTGLAYIAMHEQEDELTDELLQHEVQELSERLAGPVAVPSGVLDSTHNFQAFVTRGIDGLADVPLQARGLAPGAYQLQPDGRTWHVAVADTKGGRLTVILDATASEERVMEFGLTLLGLWLLCVVVTVWIARGVAALAVGPMAAATRLVASWSPPGSGAAASSRDEAVVLIETFNRFRDRMDDSIAREREFAANLDHEIRTPLTAIRTDAELLPLEAELSTAQRERVARIVARVDEIAESIEATRRASAGAGGPAAGESVDLFESVQSVCASLDERAGAHGLVIRNLIPSGETAVADRQALLTVVRNLVRNAIEHAAPATLVISGGQAGLDFDDDGRGIPSDDLPHVFERWYEGQRSDSRDGAGGASVKRGLGLAIARRLCDVHGWSLTARSPRADGARGTSFVLRFAPP